MIRMIRTSLLIAATFISTAVFSQKASTPIEYNDYLVTINDTLYSIGREWGTKLNTVYTSKHFDSLTPIRLKMESFIVRKQRELRNMKDMFGSEDFRQAMIEFLSFEAKMARDVFTPLEAFDNNSNTEDINKAIQKLMDVANSEGDALKKVNDAQEAFATKNGFKIAQKEND